MSVAFRRESDDEHKEPKFELPIPPGPNLVTARGLAQIEARVTTLEQATPGLAALDDERREAHRRDLRYWRQRLATAQLMPAPPSDEVGFGSRVTILLNRDRRVLEIVGDDEADPASGRIAYSAPLARALIGAGEGDRVSFGGRAEAIEILAIDAPAG